MPYKSENELDPRLHVEQEELQTFAQQLIVKLREMMGETEDSPACRDCMGTVAIQMFVELVRQAMAEKHFGEVDDLYESAHEALGALTIVIESIHEDVMERRAWIAGANILAGILRGDDYEGS